MRIVRDYQYTRPGDRGASVAIGNFDGVHLGHQAVIGLALQAVPTAPLGVLTFEPHPREFFAPDAPSFRLMSAEARTARLEKLGVDVLYQLNFNTAMASLSPREFAERVICKGLGLVNVVVGADFCFGKGRAGTVADLKAFGEEMGFGVTVAELMETDGLVVSSSAIRDALYRSRRLSNDPVALLRICGGADLAAMTGFCAQAAVRRTPMLLDGAVVTAAALAAERLAPGVRQWWQAGHRSTEPVHTLALRHLELDPIVDLGMRLGEGSGALVALPVLRAAVATLASMATFTEAGIAGPSPAE